MHCMAATSSMLFHPCKVFTFIVPCNYFGVADHKDFQLPNNQKYGSNVGGGASGVGYGGRSISTAHHDKRWEKGFWDAPTNNYDSDTKEYLGKVSNDCSVCK